MTYYEKRTNFTQTLTSRLNHQYEPKGKIFVLLHNEDFKELVNIRKNEFHFSDMSFLVLFQDTLNDRNFLFVGFIPGGFDSLNQRLKITVNCINKIC